MTIRIGDCLNIGILQNGIVLSGKRGLNRIVTGVTVQDIEIEKWDSSNTLYGGELVLSSLKFVSDSPMKQRKLIYTLNKYKVSGLVVFYLGITIPVISNELIDMSNKLDFPVIVLPKNRNDFAYIDVINIITNELMKKELHTLAILRDVLKENKNPHLGNGGFDNIIKLIGERFKIEFIIVNTFFEIMGSNTVKSKKEVQNIISYNKNILLARIDRTTNSEQVFSLDNDGKIFGYIIIINSYDLDSEKVASLLDTIRYLSRIFPFEKSKLQYENEHIKSLIYDKTNKIYRDYLIPIEEIEYIILLYFDDLEFTENRFIKIYNITRHLFIKNNLFCNISTYENNIVLISKNIVQEQVRENINDKLNIIINSISSKVSTQVKIGYVRYDYNLDSYYSISKTLDFLIKSVKVLNLLFPNKNVYDEKVLVMGQIVSDYLPTPLHFYLDNLVNILFSRKEYSATLIDTLQTYILDSDNNIEIAAEKLFIHENTLRYRLKAIEDNTGLFFNKPLDLIILTIISIITRKRNMI